MSIRALNRARRKAQATAKARAANQPRRGRSSSDHRKRIRAGATPNETLSARLSSSAPKRDCALSRRAIRPSTPSSIPATMMANTALRQSSATSAGSLPVEAVMAKRMPVRPAQSAAAVIALGTMARSVRPPRCCAGSITGGHLR